MFLTDLTQCTLKIFFFVYIEVEIYNGYFILLPIKEKELEANLTLTLESLKNNGKFAGNIN